jgi:membrane protein implicated in regulation of membrane protease activity
MLMPAFLFPLAKSIGLKGGVLIAAGLALLLLAYCAHRAEKADDQRNQEIGATVQREGDLRETITRTEKANEAAAKVERDPVARRDGCLRHSRTPENC